MYLIEMVCLFNCGIGAALIVGTVLTSLVSKEDTVFKEYRKSLSPEQITKLDAIANNRLSLYIQGTLLGIVLVTVFALSGLMGRMSSFATGCTFLMIVLVSQYFYYILMPKQDWMLLHLNSREQNDKWLRVYRYMSFRWHIGLLLGLVGFFLLGRGVRM